MYGAVVVLGILGTPLVSASGSDVRAERRRAPRVSQEPHESFPAPSSAWRAVGLTKTTSMVDSLLACSAGRCALVLAEGQHRGKEPLGPRVALDGADGQSADDRPLPRQGDRAISVTEGDRARPFVAYDSSSADRAAARVSWTWCPSRARADCRTGLARRRSRYGAVAVCQAAHEPAKGEAQRVCEPAEDVERRAALPAFDARDVGPMERRPLGQLLL